MHLVTFFTKEDSIQVVFQIFTLESHAIPNVLATSNYPNQNDKVIANEKRSPGDASQSSFQIILFKTIFSSFIIVFQHISSGSIDHSNNY